jgi:hypothetical protein
MNPHPKRPRVGRLPIAALKTKLDRTFSQYVRLRDTGPDGYGECATCGKCIHWKDGDAGHFITRGAVSTRFDPRNVNLQCKRCNILLSGRQYEHSKYIDRKHGLGTSELLLAESKQVVKLGVREYQALISHYAEQVKELERGKMG